MHILIFMIVGFLFFLPQTLILTSFFWDFIKVKKRTYIILAIICNLVINGIQAFGNACFPGTFVSSNITFTMNSLIACIFLYLLVDIPISMFFYAISIVLEFSFFVSGIQFWITWETYVSYFLELVPYYIIGTLICVIVRLYILPLFHMCKDNGIWFRHALIPFISAIAFWITLKSPALRYSKITLPKLYYLGNTVLFISSILSSVISVQSIRSQITATLLASKLSHSEELLTLQKDNYKSLTDLIEKTREYRHDMRHHMNIITVLMKEKKYKELEGYLTEYTNEINAHDSFIITNNPIIDAIITYYNSIANEKNIKTSYQIRFPIQCNVKDSDLSVIIGNCMENAIEACERMNSPKRSLSIQSKVQGSYLTLTFENTYSGIIKSKNEFYLSSKRNYKEAGIGILSINHIANQYNGSVTIEYDESKFHITVMLQYK